MAIRVLVGLIGTQPLVVNFYSGVLEGVTARLGLALPGVKNPPSSAPEGMLCSFIASLEEAVKADDAGQATGWSIQGDLHTCYTEDFVTRRADDIPSVFKSSLLPGLIKEMDNLRLQEPAVPPWPHPRLTTEDLVNEFKQLNVEGAHSLFSAVMEAARVHLDAKTMEELAAQQAQDRLCEQQKQQQQQQQLQQQAPPPPPGLPVVSNPEPGGDGQDLTTQPTPGVTPKGPSTNTKTQPTTVQPPPAAVATTVQATTTTIGAALATTQLSGVTGQSLFPVLPLMGATSAVSVHQASQRPSLALTATKRSGQTLLSGQPTKKVRILASGIEAITAPTDTSQPVMVTVARTVIPVPTQSSSSGSLTYIGTGLQPPPSFFQPRSAPTSTPRIIGTIHHPVVSQPSSILGQVASGVELGEGAKVGSGTSTAPGVGFQLPPATEPFSILPLSLIDQEDKNIQVLTNLPHSQRVYMVVDDDVDNSAPPALAAQVKREKVEVAEPARGSSCGATLPPHLNQGGSS